LSIGALVRAVGIWNLSFGAFLRISTFTDFPFPLPGGLAEKNTGSKEGLLYL
jgi:hypothetical protein